MSCTTSITTRCSIWFFVLAIEFGGDPGIVVDIARPGRSAGKWMRAHDRSVDFHEELGGGADEAVDRIPVARPEAAPQSPQHGMDVDRFARVHHDRAGDDGFGERSGADGVACRDNGGQIVVDVDAGFDPIAGRTRTGDEVRREHGGDCCIVDVAAHRHGGGAVGELAHQHLGHDHVGRCARTKPEHAESHRCCAVDGRVVGYGCEKGRGVVDRDPSGNPTARHPDGISNEEVAVTGCNVVEVERRIGEVREWSGRRLHVHHHVHRREPTISWVSPPDSWV